MNINEIAKLAGVSRATVSRYLNQGYVSEEKKTQIKKVIDETGYNPSSQAQMLRTKKTKLIGVIIPKINSESISRMVAGISSVISAEGYQLLLANTNNDEKEEIKYLNTFKYNQVDGILLIGTVFTTEHKKLLQELKVPVVILGQQLRGFSCVYQDDFHAAKELARHLLWNSRRTAYIGVTRRDKAAGRSREDGFLEAYEEYKKENSREEAVPVVLRTDFTIESAYEQAKILFQDAELSREIDTIICATDNLAIGVLKYLNENRIKVPEQVQLAGFGDSDISSVVWPKLTTVHFYYKTSGVEAANILMELLDSEEAIPKIVQMGYKLVLQESTRNEKQQKQCQGR